jgi:hypothetical protein
LELIEEQLSRVNQPVHALLLVGGFAGSEYLKERVDVCCMELQAYFRRLLYPFYRVNLVLELRSSLDHPMLIQRHCVVQLHTA